MVILKNSLVAGMCLGLAYAGLKMARQLLGKSGKPKEIKDESDEENSQPDREKRPVFGLETLRWLIAVAMARATSSVENSKGESRRSSDAMAKDELSGKKEKDVNYDHAIRDGKITKNSVENEVNLGSKETTHSDQYHEEAKSDDVGAGQSYLNQMEILSTQSEVVGEQSELIGAQSEMAEKYSFVIENMSDFSEEEQEFALLAETKTELELIDTEELESEALNLEQNIKKPTQTGAEFKQKSEEIEKRIVELEEQIANPESEKQVTEVEKQTRRDLPKTDSPRQDFESDTSERSQSIASTSTEKEIRESEPILQEYQNIKLELQLDVDTVAVEASEKIKPSQSQPAVEDEQEQPQVLPATWQEESDEHLESETNELGLKIKFREESLMEPKTSNREFSESKTTVASLDKEIRDKMDSLSVLSIEITETATAQKLESTLDEEEEPVRHVESNETETKPAVTPEQAVKSDQSINEPDLGPEKLKSEDATANELDVVFSQSQISPRPKLSEQQFAETIEDAEIKTISNKFKPTESELFETKVQQEKEELKLDIKVIKPPSSPPIPETEQTTSGTVQFTLEQETSEQTQVKQETKAKSKVTETKKETEETTEADGAFTAAEPDLPDSSSLSDEKVAGYSSIEVNEFEELKESSDTSSSSSSKFTIIDVTEEEVVLGEPPSIDDSLLKRVDESLMSLPEKNVMSVSESTSDNNDASFNGASYVDVPAQENADQSQNETIVIQDKTVDTEDDHDKTLNVETSMITPQASEEANEEATRITDIITKKTSDICDAVADEVVTSKPHASSKKVETDETIKKEENISDNPENLLESYVIKQDEETSKSAQTESVEVPATQPGVASAVKRIESPVPKSSLKKIKPEGPPPVCSVNLQLKLFHTGSRRQNESAVIEDMDMCDFKLYIKNLEGFPAKIKSKIYLKIILRNDAAGFYRKKQKTKPMKAAGTNVAINKIVEFGKVPRKMLNGRLELGVRASGGIGGSKLLCAAELELNSKSGELTWVEKLIQNKGKWLDASLSLR